MNVWASVDAFVAKHKEQTKELRSLAREGGVFRQPRFRPPCVWVLITGARHGQPGTKSVFTTFADAKAELEPHALRRRAARAVKEAERQAAKKARR